MESGTKSGRRRSHSLVETSGSSNSKSRLLTIVFLGLIRIFTMSYWFIRITISLFSIDGLQDEGDANRCRPVQAAWSGRGRYRRDQSCWKSLSITCLYLTTLGTSPFLIIQVVWSSEVNRLWHKRGGWQKFFKEIPIYFIGNECWTKGVQTIFNWNKNIMNKIQLNLRLI